MDLICDNSLYLVHVLSQSLSLFLVVRSYCHCSVPSLSRECPSNLSLARDGDDVFYVPFPSLDPRGVLSVLVYLCDRGVCVETT